MRKAPLKPNWRDPRTYEYTLTLSRRGWAWEFLRRNPAFRQAARKLKPGSVNVGKHGTVLRILTTLATLEPLKRWGVLFL